jgi:formate-dependent nitrite reductase membrane component NrfD
MIDRLAAFVVGEGNWLPLAMSIALTRVAVYWIRHSRSTSRDRVMGAMNLFVGVTLFVMGVGHLLAVTTKLAQGSLNGSPGLLYLIGVVIVMPSAFMVVNANRAKTAAANGWMAATLVILGLINIPLAIPAVLNIAYSRHSHARTGSFIVGLFLLVNVALFAGGMLFMLSGARTFEEFSM